MYDHFTVFVTNNRLWEFFVSRHRPNRVQNSSMHANPFGVLDSRPLPLFMNHKQLRMLLLVISISRLREFP
jgi:hypothetical protein